MGEFHYYDHICDIPKSNIDKIRSMSDEELAEFLKDIAYGRETAWDGQFAAEFCEKCPTTERFVEEFGRTEKFHECDFADGECPHGDSITWWLKQPAEKENGGADNG